MKRKKSNNPNEMTKADCAAYVGISIRTIDRLIKEHIIPHREDNTSIRTKYVFDKDKIDKWMLINDMI